MMKMMTAKYNGRCTGCGVSIRRGEAMAYGGKGLTFHRPCNPEDATNNPPAPDDYSNINPATGERMSNTARVHVARFAGGGYSTVNSRGRCEDAPCCGCCT